MTKSELVLRLCKRFPNMMQRDVEQLVATFFSEITETLEEGGRVELRGFGAFSIRKRAPRRARNPKNGEHVQVGERYSIYFRAGKELRERIKDIPVSDAA
jgi:integration host factor subunit beta